MSFFRSKFRGCRWVSESHRTLELRYQVAEFVRILASEPHGRAQPDLKTDNSWLAPCLRASMVNPYNWH